MKLPAAAGVEALADIVGEAATVDDAAAFVDVLGTDVPLNESIDPNVNGFDSTSDGKAVTCSDISARLLVGATPNPSPDNGASVRKDGVGAAVTAASLAALTVEEDAPGCIAMSVDCDGVVFDMSMIC